MSSSNYSGKYEVGNFKKLHSVIKRHKQYKRLRAKYPHRVPIIVEYANDFPIDYQRLEKQKYLVPDEFTLRTFMLIIRKQMTLDKKHAICMWMGGTMPKLTSEIGTLYSTFKDEEDGFLYIRLAVESTFG